MSTPINQQVAHILLEKQAVILQPDDPFTWASGIKSPIYCDNRQLLSYPKERRIVAEGLADLIKTYYPEATVIAGTATAGIPHAAWVSEVLGLPMIYVRSKAKDHGRKSQIEGKLSPNDKVVLIDDLISTGGSVLEACRPVAERATVLGVAAIFTYNLKRAENNFKEAGQTLHVLTDLHTLLKVASRDHGLTPDQLETVKTFHHRLNEN
ncbi:orotate phosphoribosyltransferase [Aerococcus christensenii]|uniref:Orotate phosphoribosyltransferase n=1 Tax=Aerococcus christensenii TaxID=87541 RepID=A0A133XRK5_9LACT|nr:orotate phosphoribosyltransferase [Aerococcus christensenii]KXB33558.1 orotate phosphoribosyltransferase [Aerococcus christensenii]